MLWTQALHLRQDLAGLRERAPDLAAVLEAARAVLNRPVTYGGLDAVGDIDQVYAAEQRMFEERRQAARDWDAAVDRVAGSRASYISCARSRSPTCERPRPKARWCS